ncbi:MAG: superoxide dismutase, partial [Alphaproteobacteria bacterium]|nr:superoxide dismutase [Alphaproteobacteria bacterium]
MIEFMELPFKKDALEPYISAKTIEFHYGKHHKAYVDKVNELIAGTEFDEMDLEEIIDALYGNADLAVL